MKSRRQKREAQPNPEIEETRIYKRSDVKGASKKRNLGKTLGIILLGITFFLGGAGYGMYSYLKGYSREYPPSSGVPIIDESSSRMNILVMGIDGGVDGKLLKNSRTGTRSDVMMVVSIDPDAKTMGILSVPRDTRVFIPKVNDLEKAGHAHAYGGPELVIQTLEQFLKIEIHRFVRVDFVGFKEIINTLGGIHIDVPENMNYKDPYQDLVIDIKEGPQTLNGDQALGFVRYREYADADIGRIKAQELFLRALADKLKSIATLPKIPKLIDDILPYVLTDLSNDDIMYLASIGLGMKLSDAKMQILPGEGGYIGDISYWLVDSDKAAKMVDELIRGIDRDKNSTVKVAIQNGCGLPGAADYIASILRGYGFNVMDVGNADRFDFEETRILAAKGKQEIQTSILKYLKTVAGDAKAYSSDEVPEGTDVLVVIGKDFKMPGR